MIDAILVIMTLVCLYTDLRYKKIYNVVLIPALAIGFLANIYTYGISGGISSIKGFVLGLILLFIPFALGGMGGGDVKLLGVIGAIKGPDFVFSVFLVAALIGGIISIVVMIRQGNFTERFKAVIFTFLSMLHLIPPVNLLKGKESEQVISFPYGIALAAGTFMAYLVR